MRKRNGDVSWTVCCILIDVKSIIKLTNGITWNLLFPGLLGEVRRFNKPLSWMHLLFWGIKHISFWKDFCKSASWLNNGQLSFLWKLLNLLYPGSSPLYIHFGMCMNSQSSLHYTFRRWGKGLKSSYSVLELQGKRLSDRINMIMYQHM